MTLPERPENRRAPALPRAVAQVLGGAFAVALFVAGSVPARAQTPPPPADPAEGEVPLAAEAGWDARLVLDQGETGIWTVKPYPVFEQYAAPELVALDDEGRCHVLVSYSGKWTPLSRVHDGAWLGGLTHGDVDPRVPGAELYTGGKSGNLYQVVPHEHGALDARLIGHLPGKEIHTILAARPKDASGGELLVFTRPGELFQVTPSAADGRFEMTSMGALRGRVRDAVALPPGEDGTPRFATVSREGTLELLHWTPEGPRWERVHEDTVGMGRIALDARAQRLTLYAGLDDGRVLRLEQRLLGWRVTTVFAGAQGLRGLVAGRFSSDPSVETLALFGYSGRVELLSHGADGDWSAETLFTDRDRGHWLAAAELDGRNGTDEIVGCGYGGRVFLLSRPPGYGRPDLAPGAVSAPQPAAPESVVVEHSEHGPVFEVVYDPSAGSENFTGRALVFLSKHEREPREVHNPARLEPVIAADFVDVPPGSTLRIDASNAIAFPAPPAELEGGTYFVQAVLDSDPSSPWPGVAPGNPYSAAQRVELGRERAPRVQLVCDRRVEGVRPTETEFVRVVELHSQRLSDFHGRPTLLRAAVHLPQAWKDDPERRFPTLFYLSGFGASFGAFEGVHWSAAPIAGEPYLVVYPDPSCSNGHSAFLDSENNGPWGRAFVEELLPYVEQRFRGLRHREARVLMGHSSGGWAALSLLARHPQLFAAAWASSPDPVDLRDFMGVDLYAPDANFLYDAEGELRAFCKLGGWTVNYTEEHARREEVLRGGVLAFFEALFGGRDAAGEPQRLFDRRTGAVDAEVARQWRENDLSAYLRDHWDRLGPWLDGRMVLTVGDNDNFLLQRSAQLFVESLEGLGAEVGFHMLSGDHFSELDGPRSTAQLREIVQRFQTWRDGAEDTSNDDLDSTSH